MGTTSVKSDLSVLSKIGMLIFFNLVIPPLRNLTYTGA